MDQEVPPPWKRAGVQKRALRQEQRNGGLPGGSRQPASGRLWNRKRDNILDDLLVETRFSDSGRYCVKDSEWADIEREAAGVPSPEGIGCAPAMQIDLGDHRLLVINLQTHLDAKTENAFLREELDAAKARVEELVEELIEARS